MVIVVISITFPGREGLANNVLFGFGKVAVAAIAFSSLYPGSLSPSNGNVRKNERNLPRAVHSPSRKVETCTFNVEILLDGCSHPLEIVAPSGRVVDVAFEDFTSKENDEDNCIMDYSANLKFPVRNESVYLDLPSNGTVDTLEFQYCLRAIEGRPFVDVSGNSLMASPFVATDDLVSSFSLGAVSWSGEVAISEDITSFTNKNVTVQSQFLLGQEWTKRALGEHASIASFSAFAIALMTNQAPSTLVEDALKAGLDEVRHARTSFEIASKLSGKNVGPGPLPPSSHEFGHDLTALALAVAMEGCVDETLSALAAAVEAEEIDEVLQRRLERTKYSNMDRETLTWIRDELRTIAMDESNHSALAWRTLHWVCNIDSNACNVVKKEVLDEAKLESRFHQRFDDTLSTKSASLSTAWKKIYNTLGNLHVEPDIIEMSDLACFEQVLDDEVNADGISGPSIHTAMATNVLRGVLCDVNLI